MQLKPIGEQVIVITGASSGIGLATARSAAKAGATLLLVARSHPELAAIAEETGGLAYVADVGEREAMIAAAAYAAARFGRIDTWISNAGVAIYARLLETPADEHEQLFRTNYFGTVHSAEAAIPHLREGGGALIVVGSIAGDIPSPVMGAYAASKHAVKGYVESLRIELQTDAPKVSLTLVKPSGIDTPIAQHAADHLDGAARIPPPVYDPQLVADAILQAAQHARREITVGGGGRAQVLFGTHFPRLLEKLAPAMTATLVDRTKPQPEPSNLFEGERAGQERSGEQSGRRTSLYTMAAMHPNLTAAASLGVVAGAAALLFALRKPKA